VKFPRAQPALVAEEGFVLIEILVSAIVLAIVAGAVFTLLNATARSAAEERHGSEAYAVAQEDQARLRSMRISELNRLNQNRTVTLNGTPFTVNSTGVFVNDTTASSSCSAGASSADYVKVASTVTWPSMGKRPAAVIQSIISPANGSLDPSHGTLTISAKNAAGSPIAGIGLSGTGAGTFSGTTDSTGCAMFPDQPSGNYTLTASGVAAGLVDKDGKALGPTTVGVIAGGTNSVSLLYDLPGSIKEVAFKTINAKGELVASSADSIVVFNTGMTLAKAFGTPGGTRVAAIEAPSLFPFASPDTVYAGSCGGDNPNPKGEASPPGAAAMASVLVPAAPGTPPKLSLQLPALKLTVKNGASIVSGARVTVSDDNCTSGGVPVKRIYTTTPTGSLASPASTAVEDPGLPWSTYDICASANISGNRRNFATNVPVQDLTNGTSLTIDLSGAGSESGGSKTCP
jgi:type II secretory pathway pseudopilin PulG